MTNNSNGRIGSYRLLAFAAPGFVTALVHGPMAGILPTLIVKHYGVEMAAVSTLLLFSRMFDGVTDPLVGFLSDRTRSPIGKRKPWIIAGSVVIMIAASQLFMPPATAGFGFFMTWMLLITLGWTISEVPYGAWIPEITGDYNERTRIQTYRSSVAIFGGLALSAAPLLPMFETNEMTPAVLRLVGWAILFVLPPAIFAALVLNKQGKDVSIRDDLSVKGLISSLKGNRPFQYFILMVVPFGLSLGIEMSLGFLVFAVYLGIGDKFPQIMISHSIVSLISLPIWMKISSRIGKNRSLAISGLIGISIPLYLPFVDPGPSAFYPYLIISLAQALAFGAYSVCTLPLLADIVDYDILKTGVNRAGQYLSFMALLSKFNGAIGGAIGFFLLGIFGFDANNTIHTPAAVKGLLFTFVGIPFLLGIPSAYLAWRFPITRHRQKIIRKRIEQRALRIKKTGTAMDEKTSVTNESFEGV